MSHELYLMADGQYAMARSADSGRSWHGVEDVLPEDASVDDWKQASGMNFNIKKALVEYKVPNDGLKIMKDRVVLYRDDTSDSLSIVSPQYNVVQPGEVMDFFTDLCRNNGLKMDTAGVIRGGVKFWALARTGEQVTLHNGDKIKQYLLLGTSVDHSMATTAKHTSERVVCSNTFHLNMGNGEKAIRVNHSAKFDAKQVKIDLGLLNDEFKTFRDIAEAMADINTTTPEARRWFAELFSGQDDMDLDAVNAYALNSRLFNAAMQSHKEAPGHENTVWGMFNAITHMVDHTQGRSTDARLNSSMFDAGDQLKQKAWKKAVELV